MKVVLIQWVKQLPQTLLSALTLIVFTSLDLLDSLFCKVFALLDELVEGNSALSCYCQVKRQEEIDVADQMTISETLYGDSRPNLFREMGFGWLMKRLERMKERKWRREKLNRWSDCGCETCVSWMRKKKKGDEGFSLHVVVQEPQTSPGK